MSDLSGKTPSFEKDQWLIAKGEEAGLPMIFRMRKEVPPGVRTKKYPRIINIYWRYEDASNNGLPPELVLKRMGELEERLDGTEGLDNGFMVLSITGNQRKEWIWYVCDERRFIERLNRALAGPEPFPIELHAANDPKWKSFTSLLAKVRK
jgi:hypothetical protein